MKQFLLSIVLLVATLILHPFIRHWVALAQLIPLLVIFWAWKLDPVQFIVTAMVGAFLNDIIVGDTLGFTALIWGILIFLTRTQIPWLEMYVYIFVSFIAFAGTVIYLTISRLAFMAHYRIWGWNLDLTSHIFLSALFNVLISLVIFPSLNVLYHIAREKPREADTLSHVHP